MMTTEMDWSADENESDDDNDKDHDPNRVWDRIQASQVFDKVPSVAARDSGWSAAATSTTTTRFVLMSDTHGKHRHVALPQGDVLIHAGDLTISGDGRTLADLGTFFGELLEKKHFHEVICIAGNHDITLHPSFYEENWNRFHDRAARQDLRACAASIRKNCTYLEDASTTTSKGNLHVYGSPWSPEFYSWAFNLPRGPPIRAKWDLIPSSTDILITHGPPMGRGDETAMSVCAGCYDLLDQVQTRIRPRLHVFGHIHESFGATYDGTTLYVNAANVNLHYRPVIPCMVVDVPHDKNQPARLVTPSCRMQASDLKQWFRNNGYSDLEAHLKENAFELVIQSNDLSRVHAQLCATMELHRDRRAQDRVQQALAQLYAQSF